MRKLSWLFYPPPQHRRVGDRLPPPSEIAAPSADRTFTKVRSWPGLSVRDAGRQLPLSNLAITPKDCFRASPRTHRPGQFRSSESQEKRVVNGRFQTTADIARRPFEAAHSPERSPKVLPRWSASEAVRMSAGRATELELPTQCRHSIGCIGCRKADDWDPCPPD